MLGKVDRITLDFVSNHYDIGDSTPENRQQILDVEKDNIDFIFWGTTLVKMLEIYINKEESRQCTFRICSANDPSLKITLGTYSKTSKGIEELIKQMKDSGLNVLFVVGTLHSLNHIDLCFYMLESVSGFGATYDQFVKIERGTLRTRIVKGESWITPLQVDILYLKTDEVLVENPRSVISHSEFVFDHLGQNGDVEDLEVMEGLMFRRDDIIKYGCLNVVMEYYKQRLNDAQQGPVKIRNPIILARLKHMLPKENDVSTLTEGLLSKVLDKKEKRFGDLEWQEPVMKKSGPCPIHRLKLANMGDTDEQEVDDLSDILLLSL